MLLSLLTMAMVVGRAEIVGDLTGRHVGVRRRRSRPSCGSTRSARTKPRVPSVAPTPSVHSLTLGDFSPFGSSVLSTPGTEGAVRNGRMSVPPLAKNQSKIICRATSVGISALGGGVDVVVDTRPAVVPVERGVAASRVAVVADALGQAPDVLAVAGGDHEAAVAENVVVARRGAG